MYTRTLNYYNQSFFLFGPRGTGKSTWIKQNYPEARTYDFLNQKEFLKYSRNDSSFYDECALLPPNTWVVVDEVQKIPSILDSVHRLIEEKKLLFLLSGSSARKLKKGGANLLAGRAHTLQFFPFVLPEINYDRSLENICRYGLLPLAITQPNPANFLLSYVETYLSEEIKSEALTRNIGAFNRFLEIAARQNAQVTNMLNISREASVNRATVENYFQILVDTLIGTFLKPWKLKPSTKQIKHPKFYFFDPGVVRALVGRVDFPPIPEETGFLFETYIFHELRAYLSYHQLHYPITYWSSYDQVEVDFLIETPRGFIALEVKSVHHWEKKFNLGLKRIRQEIGSDKVNCYGVFNDDRETCIEDIPVYPWKDFVKKLWRGEIIN